MLTNPPRHALEDLLVLLIWHVTKSCEKGVNQSSEARSGGVVDIDCSACYRILRSTLRRICHHYLIGMLLTLLAYHVIKSAEKKNNMCKITSEEGFGGFVNITSGITTTIILQSNPPTLLDWHVNKSSEARFGGFVNITRLAC